jgi:type II secretory pathway component GspD/PulD (secretin)
MGRKAMKVKGEKNKIRFALKRNLALLISISICFIYVFVDFSVPVVKADSGTQNASSSIQTVSANPSKVTIDVEDGDIRDILSTLALDMGASIIYTDEVKKVSLHMQDTAPLELMKLVVEKEGLSYIKNGNVIIVGKPDVLQKNYFDHMVLTRYGLKYIDADKVSAQIDKFGLVLQKISLEDNQSAIWVQGTPQVLGKVREIVNALDIPGNSGKDISFTSYPLTYIPANKLVPIISQLGIDVRIITVDTNTKKIWVQGSAGEIKRFGDILKKLDIADNKFLSETMVKIDLKYITPGQLEPVVTKVGIPVKVLYVESNTESIWVLGSAQGISDLKNLVKQLDIIENYAINPNSIQQISLKYISSEKLAPLIGQLGLNVNVITVGSNQSMLWIQGQDNDIEPVRELIENVDIESNSADLVIFAVDFNNITASQAIEGLSLLNLSDVKAILIAPKVLKSLVIICPKSKESTVRGALFNLDMEMNKIMAKQTKVKVPVDYSADTITLETRKALIVSLTGVNNSSFKISGNVSRGGGTLFVLWLEDTAGNVKKVQEAIKMIDKPLDTDTPSNFSAGGSE